MTKIESPGIYDIPPEVYHADPVATPSLSASIAKILLQRSPRHAWIKHPRLNPDFEPEHKAIFDLGSAAHNMVLRQDFWREEIDIVEAANWTTKAAREARDMARAEGRYPLLRDQYERLERMVSELENHPQASQVFRNGKPERTLIWQDEETGAWCRCRPDWEPDPQAQPWPDYKTTADANPADWDRRHLLDRGGLLGAAWYREGIRRVCGIDDPTLYYVVQEVAPPYSIVVRVFDNAHEMSRIADAMLRKALAMWQGCMITGKWPGYDLTGVMDLPEWSLKRLQAEYAPWRPKSKEERELEELIP